MDTSRIERSADGSNAERWVLVDPYQVQEFSSREAARAAARRTVGNWIPARLDASED